VNKYIHTPDVVKLQEVIGKNYTLSSAQYKKLVMYNDKFRCVSDFLSRPLSRKDLGAEIGSINYVDKSPYCFIRTKALQDYSYLPVFNKETALPMMPSEFVQMNLKEGDLLISKDSNIGEIVILDKDYPQSMLSGALYRLPVKEEWRYYLLAFIKHDIFREQLDFMVPKGATIRHAKTLFLDCKIPLPKTNEARCILFISQLTNAIINKEKLIRKKHETILQCIEEELRKNQIEKTFCYHLPRLDEIKEVGRLDASLYKYYFKKGLFEILNYKNGYSPLTEQDLELIPGPSLELKLLGTRIDSNHYIKGFYRLITPKQITNYGVVRNEEYIGTPAKIANIKFGDILFGESGTGRTMVFLDNDSNTINNAHAHILRSKRNNDLNRIITIRSILQYYKEIGLTDCMTVGGSGGHLSPSYFDRIMIPNFPASIQDDIAIQYYCGKEYDTTEYTLENFLEKDEIFNSIAGIYELDKSAKILKRKLDIAIDDVINGREVRISFH